MGSKQKVFPGNIPEFDDYRGQGALYQILENDFRNGHPVHSYIICGEQGMGKKTLAAFIAQTLLCAGEKPPCRSCGACVRCGKGTHIDLTYLVPDKNKPTIGPHLVRRVINTISYSAYESRNRVVIVEQAETLTGAAQNCLLSVMENPPSNVFFLLVITDASLLLRTIVSRCRLLRLSPWRDEDIMRVLIRTGVDAQQAGQVSHTAFGNLGRAYDAVSGQGASAKRSLVFDAIPVSGDPGLIYNLWQKQRDKQNDADMLLAAIDDFFHEMLRNHVTHTNSDAAAAYPPVWQRFASEASYEAYGRIFTAIHRTRLLKENNVSWQTAFESLLFDMIKEIQHA